VDAELRPFLAELRRRRYSRALQERATHVLPRLFSHLRDDGVTDVRSVTEAHLVRFVRRFSRTDTRFGRPPSQATMYAYVAVVRRFFAFLARRRMILQDPARFLVWPKTSSLPSHVLSERDVSRLVTATYPVNARHWKKWSGLEVRDRAILELLYGTGIRLGECARLDAVDLDLFQGQLWVRNGKGRKDRLVPVTGAAAAALDVYLGQVRPELLRDPREGALFLTWEGRRLSPITIRVLLKRQAKEAGLDVPVTPHALRHSCATHLLRNGADIREVQQLLGHSRIETTSLYTQVVIGDLKKAILKAHPRERYNRPNRGTP
jgi:integrase/recombinase XerD